jgi:beta-N-acetylhexosaminidase
MEKRASALAGRESERQRWPWAGPWPRGDELKPESLKQGSKSTKKGKSGDRKPRRERALLIGLVVLVLIAAVIFLVVRGGSDDESSSDAAAPPPAEIEKVVTAMSPEQKAQAVLAAGFTDPNAAVKQAGTTQLGGFVVGPSVWPGAGQGRRLLAQISAAGSTGGRVPPLLITQQEGGQYNSLRDLPPALRQIDITTPQQALDTALQTDRALRAAGFDMNLAPVADVATLDSPVADRAFSDDPTVVSILAASAAQGCLRSGLACAASHFPGLGGASNDPAEGPATVSLDAGSLENRDLLAFQAAFSQKLPAVVLSLAAYPAYDPVTPAALSPNVINDVLRDQYGFDGVAITDDLSSGAITAGIGPAEGAVEAIAAGADLVQIGDPTDAAQALPALAQAIQSGDISSQRIDEAVGRVLLLKRKLGLLPAEKKPAKKQE